MSSQQGYLPQDRQPPLQMTVSGIQHLLTMFAATTLVAILVGMPVSVTVFGAGAFTIVGLLLTKKRIPLFYGSSFSYIAALIISVKAWGIEATQVGIVATGVFQILVGLAVRWLGMANLKRIIPTCVAGPAAVVIGLSLLPAAMNMSTGNTIIKDPSASWLLVAVITLVVTIFSSVLLRNKGFIGMIPVVIGATFGYVVSWFSGLVDFKAVSEAAWFAVPPFTAPNFTSPNALNAIFAVTLMAVATVPESIAHLFQTSLYIDKQAEEMGRPPLKIANLVDLNLMVDGLIDVLRGLIGAVPGTNYGENISLMVITRNYSSWALLVGGAIAMVLAFAGKLMALVATVPTAVMGGLSMYLFAVIGIQGLALMAGDVPGGLSLVNRALRANRQGNRLEVSGYLEQIADKFADVANLFSVRDLSVIAVILAIGLGSPSGVIPVLGWPAIATGVFAGLVLNSVYEFIIPEKEVVEAERESVQSMASAAGS